jgi:cytochrome oxidase Cu insertion factor (SCO1/SenC/PrrC family)
MRSTPAILRRPVLIGALLALLGGALAAGWTWYLLRGRSSGTDQATLEGLQVFGGLPEFSLTAEDGRRVNSSDLLGKVWVANFIYTRCTDTCPLQSARMAELQTTFANERDLRLISITVDPKRDTVTVLAQYAARFQADHDRWWFLTGNQEAIYALVREGFHLSVEDPTEAAAPRAGSGPPRSHRVTPAGWRIAWEVLDPFRVASASAHSDSDFLAPPFLHSSWFVLGDRQGRIRGYYRTEDEQALKRLRRDIRTLLADRT